MLTLKTFAHLVLGATYTMECFHVGTAAATWLVAAAYILMALVMLIDDLRK